MELTSPLAAMLTPLSTALDGSFATGGSGAIAFMSGSATAPGITMTGSSPGCQRSMLSAAPIDDLPKNRLAVFTENPSRDGAGSSAMEAAPGATFKSSDGWASSDIETSYCASGGALSASASSGSSGGGLRPGMAAAVFAPLTEALDVDGSSFAGAAPAGVAGWGGTRTRRSPFRVRSTLGKSDG